MDYVKANDICPPEKEPERWIIVQYPVPQPISQHNPITTDDIPSNLNAKLYKITNQKRLKFFGKAILTEFTPQTSLWHSIEML